MGAFTIRVVNNRDATDLNLLLTVAGTATGYDSGALKPGVSTLATTFLAGGGTLSADVLDGCRLYVGYGTLPAAPDPNGTQYYGWIEFSKSSATDELWINLSNVDIVGLPLALDGTTAQGAPFSLGYKDSVQDIVKTLKAKALTGASPSAALKTCTNGSEKVIAPNIQFPAYKSFQPYLDALVKAKAPITIHTDTPSGGSAKVFTGAFSSGGTILSLTSGTDTFAVKTNQFTTEFLYRCDGGTVVYNGTTVPMNQNDQKGTDADAVYANSLFRLLCVGINEGYFTTDGPNDSSTFASETPFAGGHGNVYAEVIHASSNSYGFPYADGNLKTLVQAGGSSTVTLTILKDDEAGHYSAS